MGRISLALLFSSLPTKAVGEEFETWKYWLIE